MLRITLASLVVLGCSSRAAPEQQPTAAPTVAHAASPPVSPPPVSAATAPVSRGSISAGRGHVCVRTADAAAACWGMINSDLADLIPTPARIAGPTHVAGVATGDFENCAWTAEGAVWCWGLVGPDRAAHQLPQLASVVEVTGDSVMMCARTRTGGVTCWARDVTGEGGAAKPLVLHEVHDLHDAVELAVAGGHACARRTGGAVVCWDDRGGRLVPKAAAGGAIAIVGGSTRRYSTEAVARFVALMPGGKLVAWTAEDQPWQLPALPADVVRIGIGSEQVCALGHDLTCWDLEKPGAKPTVRAGLDGAVDVAIGESVSCVRTARGQVKCWGIADRVGNGATLLQPTPVEVVGLDDTVELAIGFTTCARKRTGSVACWGSEPPSDVGVTDAVELAVGSAYACARRASGDVSCWGASDDHGKPRWAAPTVVPELAKASGLVVIAGNVCARRAGKTVCPRYLGLSVGDETREWHATLARVSWSCTERASRPAIACRRMFAGRHDDSEDVVDTELGPLTDVADLILPRGDEITYVLRKSGEVGCHTDREGEGEFRPVPVDDKVLAIAAAPSLDGSPTETCGLLARGEVACWVDPAPTQVRELPGLTDAVQLVGTASELGSNVLCARRRTGKVMCWGARDRLGDGGPGSDAPVIVNGLAL